MATTTSHPKCACALRGRKADATSVERRLRQIDGPPRAKFVRAKLFDLREPAPSRPEADRGTHRRRSIDKTPRAPKYATREFGITASDLASDPSLVQALSPARFQATCPRNL